MNSTGTVVLSKENIGDVYLVTAEGMLQRNFSLIMDGIDSYMKPELL